MDRLAAALECVSVGLPSLAPFLIQHGATRPPHGWTAAVFMTPNEIQSTILAADIVVTHGGPATIAAVRSAGKIPVVVPRAAQFGEHVDNHQVRYTRKLAAAGEVLLVEDVGGLVNALSRYATTVASMPPARAHDPSLAIEAFAALAKRLATAT
jgi:UDP-N-acetylglucosamine transferase subunit ALG13